MEYYNNIMANYLYGGQILVVHVHIQNVPACPRSLQNQPHSYNIIIIMPTHREG